MFNVGKSSAIDYKNSKRALKRFDWDRARDELKDGRPDSRKTKTDGILGANLPQPDFFIHHFIDGDEAKFQIKLSELN